MPWCGIKDMELKLCSFLTSEVDGSEWSASCCGCFITRQQSPSTLLLGSLAGLRGSLDMMVKRIIGACAGN
jgi:hypothetical protein